MARELHIIIKINAIFACRLIKIEKYEGYISVLLMKYEVSELVINAFIMGLKYARYNF